MFRNNFYPLIMDIIDIIIIGYYNHYNLGDDQYMSSFINLFKFIKYNSIKFVDCDKIFNTEIKDTDIIILGGGDVLNNYFINNINIKFENKPNKLFAISVGLPYTYILTNTGKLNIFDHIFNLAILLSAATSTSFLSTRL